MKKFISFAVVICLLLGSLCVMTFADFGDFAGGNDYGDYGGGGGGRDNDDRDYGGGRSYRNDRSSSDDDYDRGSSEEVGWLPAIIVIGALIALIIWGTHDSKPTIRKGRSKGANNVSHAPTKGVDVGDRSTKQSSLRQMSEYRSVDPDFDESALVEHISNLYVRMQNCWTAGDISELRPYFTDALFTQFERQLAQLTAAGKVNHVDRISVQNVTLRGFRQDGGKDHIIAKVETRIVDYTVDKSTGNVVSGSDSREKFMTYEWDMTRSSGFGTLKKDGVGKKSCPNCGAPLDINVSARCEYCGGVITSSEHDWAIAKITGLSQKTM